MVFYADCLKSTYFYPRSPCGERPLYSSSSSTPAVHFYPRSPCGERLSIERCSLKKFKFLSTLSLRRATTGLGVGLYLTTISIHALLAESDTVIAKPLS